MTDKMTPEQEQFQIQAIDVPQSANEEAYYGYIAMMKDYENQQLLQELYESGELESPQGTKIEDIDTSDDLPF